MPLNPETLKTMKEAAEKATPGPWHAPGLGEIHSDHDNNVYVRVYAEDDLRHGSDEYMVADGVSEHDAAFITFCDPTNVSALIAEVERQAGEIAELRDIVDALADTGKCHYDHHGYCQEHLWFKSDVECPHARAQKLWDMDGNELPVGPQ